MYAEYTARILQASNRGIVGYYTPVDFNLSTYSCLAQPMEPGDFEPISEGDALSRVEKLQHLNTETQNIDELKEVVESGITRGMQNEAIILDEGTTIYRARILEEKPTRVSDLSYPPEDVAGLNRANREQDPVFYASSGAGAAVFELNPQIGENVAIIKWGTTDEIVLNPIGYSSEVLNRLDSSREPAKIPGNGLADTESRGNLVLRKYLAKLFTQDVPENEKHRHKITAAIAEHWRSGEPLDGIMYPTVKMWANEDNLAIDTGVVDQALLPISAEFIEIQGKEGKEIEMEVLDTAKTIQNGEIHWNGHGRQWVLENDGAWGEFKVKDGRWRVEDSEAGGVTPQHDPDFEY